MGYSESIPGSFFLQVLRKKNFSLQAFHRRSTRKEGTKGIALPTSVVQIGLLHFRTLLQKKLRKTRRWIPKMAAIFGAGATFPSRPIILGIYVKFRGCLQSSSIPSKEFRVWKSTVENLVATKGQQIAIGRHCSFKGLFCLWWFHRQIMANRIAHSDIFTGATSSGQVDGDFFFLKFPFIIIIIIIITIIIIVITIIIIILYIVIFIIFFLGGSQKAECECSKTKPPFQITTTPKFHISVFWSSNLMPCYCALLLGGIIGMPCSKLMAISTIPILQLLGS